MESFSSIGSGDTQTNSQIDPHWIDETNAQPATMTRRRWTADQVEANVASLLGDHAKHLSRVLRAQIGQQYDISTPDGVREGRIIAVKEDQVDFELGALVPTTAAPTITLALAIFKFDRMEWAIEKATELGASTILPVIAARTEKHLAQAAMKRAERWRRLALQASEQSRRATPPEIADPLKFDHLLTNATPNRIVLAETEQQTSLLSLLSTDTQDSPLILAIGPEGGWTPAEIKSFAQNNWHSATLGPTILRAETAAIAALAVAFSNLQ